MRVTSAEKVVQRWEGRARAAVFFMRCALANSEHIAVENPVGFMNTAYRKPDQTIQPYMFADSTEDAENYVTKATCLWLKGLPKLSGGNLPKPNLGEMMGRYKNGKAKTWEDTAVRDPKERSKSFYGIARAFATQWGDYLLSVER